MHNDCNVSHKTSPTIVILFKKKSASVTILLENSNLKYELLGENPSFLIWKDFNITTEALLILE